MTTGSAIVVDVRLRSEWIAKVGYRYDVLLGDEVIVRRSRDPGHDAARALLALGHRGRFRTIDFRTGMPRMSYDIEKAARLSIIERNDTGLVIVPYRRMSEGDKARARLHRTDRGRRSAPGLVPDAGPTIERPGGGTGATARVLRAGGDAPADLEDA